MGQPSGHLGMPYIMYIFLSCRGMKKLKHIWVDTHVHGQRMPFGKIQTSNRISVLEDTSPEAAQP